MPPDVDEHTDIRCGRLVTVGGAANCRHGRRRPEQLAAARPSGNTARARDDGRVRISHIPWWNPVPGQPAS